MESKQTTINVPKEAWQSALSAALSAGLFAFLLLGGSTLLEGQWLQINPTTVRDWAHIFATGFLLGFAPIALLSLATCWLERRHFGALAVRALFWLTSAVAVVGSLFLGLLDVRLEYSELNFGLLAGFASLILLKRIPPLRGGALPFWLFPVGLGWLASAFALALLMQDIGGAIPLAARILPVATGITAPVLFAASTLYTHYLRGRLSEKPPLVHGKVLSVVLVVSVATCLTALGFLHGCFVGIYLPLKAWLSLSVAAAFFIFFAPVLADLAARLRGVPRLGALLGATGLVATLFLTAQPIPHRFGAYPAKSLAGLLSFADDSDEDGFYAEAAGGKDCDDNDARRTPVASSPKRNCWAMPAGALSGNHSSDTPSKQSAEQAFGTRADHVFLTIIDAVRADVAYAQEGDPVVMPNLQRIAKESVVFDRAYTPGNSTMQSILSMIAGVSPLDTLSSIAHSEPVSPEELLGNNSVFMLVDDQKDAFCTVMLAYTHGVEDWLIGHNEALLDFSENVTEHSPSGHSAPLVASGVERALDRCADKRLMLVVYMDDPHRDDRKRGYTCADGSIAEKPCYLVELAISDKALGELYTLFETRGILERTLFMVTSDHGEAFGEHGHTTHSSSVYDEQVRVPLLVRAPGWAPREVSSPVSLLGFKSTVGRRRSARAIRRAHLSFLASRRLQLLERPGSAHPQLAWRLQASLDLSDVCHRRRRRKAHLRL